MDIRDLDVSVSSHLTFLVEAKILGNVLFEICIIVIFVGYLVSNALGVL